MTSDLEAAADGVPPLIPDHAPDARHRVKPHIRNLPPLPTPEDRGQMNLDDVLGIEPLPPGPRQVPVKGHHRKNPRRTKETVMETDSTLDDPVISTPRPPLATQARARTGDPSTSHAAAASITDLRPSQREVLAAFQARFEWGGGWTDEALVAHLEEQGSKTSPSRIRTARKELQRGDLLQVTGRATTRRGRPCDIYDLTEAGREADLKASE